MRKTRTITFLLLAALTAVGLAGQQEFVYKLWGTPFVTPLVAVATGGGKIDVRKNVVLAQPSKQSPFRKQGLEHLDFIKDVESVDGTKRLSDLGDFQTPHFIRLLAGLPARSEVVIQYFRKGQPRSQKIKVPEPALEDMQELRRAFPDTYYFAGAMLADMPREAAHFQGMGRVTGVVIAGMLEESALAKAGVRKGDVFLAGFPAGNEAPCLFESLSSFLQCADRFSPSGPIRLQAMRDKTSFEIDLTVPGYVLADIRQRLHAPVQPPVAAEAVASAIPSQIAFLSITPTPVRAGEPFEASVRFRAAAAGQSAGPVESKLHLRILAGDQTLMSVAPVSVRSRSGALMEHVFRLKAAGTPGYFVVEVTLEDPSNRIVETATLQVE